MKICYDMIYWHRSRHRQGYYDVIIYLLALIRIRSRVIGSCSYSPVTGSFVTIIAHGSNFPPIPAPIFVKFEQNFLWFKTELNLDNFNVWPLSFENEELLNAISLRGSFNLLKNVCERSWGQLSMIAKKEGGFDWLFISVFYSCLSQFSTHYTQRDCFNCAVFNMTPWSV